MFIFDFGSCVCVASTPIVLWHSSFAWYYLSLRRTLSRQFKIESLSVTVINLQFTLKQTIVIISAVVFIVDFLLFDMHARSFALFEWCFCIHFFCYSSSSIAFLVESTNREKKALRHETTKDRNKKKIERKIKCEACARVCVCAMAATVVGISFIFHFACLHCISCLHFFQLLFVSSSLSDQLFCHLHQTKYIFYVSFLPFILSLSLRIIK